MKPWKLGPKDNENPQINQSNDPITKPVKVCISIDKAFFRRIIPACAKPNAGVCSITNVVAIIINDVSPSFNCSHPGGIFDVAFVVNMVSNNQTYSLV